MPTTHPDPLPAEVIAAIQRGEKIDAIRILRERTGAGLAEAKDAVDAWADGHPPVLTAPTGTGGGTRVLQLLVMAIALAAAIYFFLPALR